MAADEEYVHPLASSIDVSCKKVLGAGEGTLTLDSLLGKQMLHLNVSGAGFLSNRTADNDCRYAQPYIYIHPSQT